MRIADDMAPSLVAGGASMLALSVLTDSSLEHYRGSFRNRAMFAPLLSATLSLAANVAKLAGHRGSGLGRAANIVAIGTGLVGLGFHAWNISKRPGAPRVESFFYSAPIGAPAALILTGSLGLMADSLATHSPASATVGQARMLGALVSGGLLGTVGEAALLHFRGAYHDPFMWLPVVVPPVAAAALARDCVAGQPSRLGAGATLATAVLGIAGAGFHAYGIARNMGGWRNWRQNLLAGPPIPAPPAFTGLAIAGIGALLWLRKARHA